MTRRRFPAPVIAALCVIFLAAGCGALGSGEPGSTGSTTSTSDTSASTSTGTTSDQSSGSSPATGPESTSIPGYDGWSTVNPAAVDVGATQTGFALTLTRRAEWAGTSRGALFYTTMDGDFRLTATVQATRTSDSSLNPGGDGTSQLAGVMARREASGESWVLIEVGGNATGLTLATDSTRDGVGHLVSKRWNDSAADLKICRTGTTFTFWYRAASSDNDWTAAGQADRKDLAGVLQVGASLSADASPDLTGFFDNLTVEPMDPGEAC